jgi:hypothetical protein
MTFEKEQAEFEVAYQKALVAVKAERKAHPHLEPSRGSSIHMSTTDREKLGALFNAFAAKHASSAREGNFGNVEYTFKTKVGDVKVHYVVGSGSIYGRFSDPKLASETVSDVNRFSGKWNFESSKGDDPKQNFDRWKRAINHIMDGK